MNDMKKQFADSVKRAEEYRRQREQDKDFFDYMCELKGDVKKYKKKYKKLKARVKELEEVIYNSNIYNKIDAYIDKYKLTTDDDLK